jgi:hypothetical protein
MLLGVNDGRYSWNSTDLLSPTYSLVDTEEHSTSRNCQEFFKLHRWVSGQHCKIAFIPERDTQCHRLNWTTAHFKSGIWNMLRTSPSSSILDFVVRIHLGNIFVLTPNFLRLKRAAASTLLKQAIVLSWKFRGEYTGKNLRLNHFYSGTVNKSSTIG